MIQSSPVRPKSKMPVVVLVLSMMVPLFWFLSLAINVYKKAWLGAVFEILWLPMLALLFIAPVFAFVCWAKNKFNLRSLYFYSLIISVLSILLFVIGK